MPTAASIALLETRLLKLTPGVQLTGADATDIAADMVRKAAAARSVSSLAGGLGSSVASAKAAKRGVGRAHPFADSQHGGVHRHALHMLS